MQEFPVYTVHAEAGEETGVDVEMRVQMGAGGGLPGMANPDVVVQALMAAMTEAGATVVSGAVAAVQTSSVSTG